MWKERKSVTALEAKDEFAVGKELEVSILRKVVESKELHEVNVANCVKGKEKCFELAQLILQNQTRYAKLAKLIELSKQN